MTTWRSAAKMLSKLYVPWFGSAPSCMLGCHMSIALGTEDTGRRTTQTLGKGQMKPFAPSLDGRPVVLTT